MLLPILLRRDGHVIAHELRRLTHHPSTPRCPQLETAVETLGWTCQANGVFVTPFGEFQPGFISLSTARAAAEDSWLRRLWAEDPKTSEPLARDQHFSLHAQRGEARFWGCRGHRRRILHAAAHDTRTLERMGLPFQACTCGENTPTRTHVTFQCPALAHPDLAGRTEAEQRLLVPLLPGLRDPQWAFPEPSQELLLALTDARVVRGCLLAATDGSSLQDTALPSMSWYRHAAYGIAFSSTAQFSGEVPGLDRTPTAAERYALLVLAHAVSVLETPVLALTDNKALAHAFQHAACATSSQLGGYWQHLFALLPEQSQCIWVPAHNRHPEWQCSVEGVSDESARCLNEAADAAATSCNESHAVEFQANQARHRSAVAWARLAIVHQEVHTKAWHESVFAVAHARRQWREL